MAIELHFCKPDNTPWGFRLTGGADCDIPLTVIKVNEGSIAEEAGLEVDDVIVRINDDATAGLTHLEAHDAFLAAGSEFCIAVRRGDVIEVQNEEHNNEEISNIMETSLQQSASADFESAHETNVMQSEKSSSQANSILDATDQQILEAISGETELLPEQNILGVNFNKIDLTDSTVLKEINEQTTETKVDLQNKKWSTFLQKPKTPKIIPKKKEPEGPTAPPYRVIIKKQPKKTAETAKQKAEVSPALLLEETDVTNIQEPEEPREESEVYAESQEDEQELEQEDEEELVEETTNDKKVMDDEVSSYSEERIGASTSPDEKISDTVTTESPPTLEEQLAQVQQQLQALSQLPSAIQVSLDAVTQQLAKIVRATHKGDEETTVEQNANSDDERTEQYIEDTVAETSDIEEEPNIEKSDHSDILEDRDEDEEEAHEQIEEDLKMSEILEEEHEQQIDEEEQEREQIEKEKAEQQERKLMQLEESHQRRLEQRPTHPLTPLQRPIILPGGRRWSQPKDALPTPRKPKMTDEKISETLENYSEVITGRLKGINFLKYQPPPKNLDYLQHSEVFRLVHDMDPPRRGIAARPGKIVSEQDYYTEKSYESGQQTSVGG